MILFPVIHILVLTFEMTDATHIPVQVLDILSHRAQYQNMIRPVCQIANNTTFGQRFFNFWGVVWNILPRGLIGLLTKTEIFFDLFLDPREDAFGQKRGLGAVQK